MLVDRFYQYFSTYKLVLGHEVDINTARPHGREKAELVVAAAIRDYQDHFGD